MHWSIRRVVGWLRLCGVLLVAAAGLPAHTQWLRAESDHVVVFSDSEEKVVRAFVQKLERFHALLEYRLAGQRPALIAKLTVYLVRSRDDLLTALPRVDRNIAGLYVPSANGVYAIAIADDAIKRDEDDTLLHEYTHHYSYQRLPQGDPTWITEGLAEYFATADVVGARITVGKPNRYREFALATNPMIDFGDVLTGSPWQGDAIYANMYYAQSWLLTHYLLQSDKRRASAQKTFAAIRRGESPVAAFQAHFGLDMVGLGKELDRYAKTKLPYSIIDIELPDPPINITPLPASADRLMLANIGFMLGFNDDQSLETLRAGLKRDPTDTFAVECAARAETQAGEPRYALELLAPLLANANASPEQHYLAGVAKLAVAAKVLKEPNADITEAKAARLAAANHFAVAIRGDETDYRALYKYWQIRALNGETLDGPLQDVLQRAYDLAPQVREIAFSTGLMLLGVHRTASARAIFIQLAGDPHNQKLRATARRLLDYIDALPAGRAPTAPEIAAALEEPKAPTAPGAPSN